MWFWTSTSMALIVVFLATSLSAATVKRKTGELVEGTLQGVVVVREEPVKREAQTFTATYYLTEGKDVAWIDERGLLAATREFEFVSASREGKPPDDLEALRVGIRISAGALHFQQTEKAGVVLRFKGSARKDPEPRRGVILGTLEKNASGANLLPELQIQTANGLVRVPADSVISGSASSAEASKPR